MLIKKYSKKISICQTGLESINYEGTCSDGLDNDCDTKIDDLDEDCAASVSLSVSNGNLHIYKFFAIGGG